MLLLCNFFQTALHLVIIDKPVIVTQLRDTVYHTSLQVGILKPIIPHKIEEDPPEIWQIKIPDPTAATDLASLIVVIELGQSTCSLQKDIIADYIGTSTTDNWAKGTSANLQNLFGLGINRQRIQKAKK